MRQHGITYTACPVISPLALKGGTRPVAGKLDNLAGVPANYSPATHTRGRAVALRTGVMRRTPYSGHPAG